MISVSNRMLNQHNQMIKLDLSKVPQEIAHWVSATFALENFIQNK